MSATCRGPVEVSYLFIDGAYLRGVVKSLERALFEDPLLPVAYGAIAQGFTKVFYYDCPPPQLSQESLAKYAERIFSYEDHCRRIRSLRGWHVIEGVVKNTGKRARQKEIDILIAVDMLTHTYRKNMHRVAFVAGDRDFRPLVEAIVREGMFIELWYEAPSASLELIHAADARLPINPFVLHSWLERHYQQAHPMPARYSQPGKDPERGTLIAHIDSNSRCVELYKAPHHYVIIQPDTNNDGYYMHMRHADLDFLKKVHALTDGNHEWVDVINA